MHSEAAPVSHWQACLRMQGIPAGRIFLRRFLDTAYSVEGLESKLLINNKAIQDIQWSLYKISFTWNCTALFINSGWTSICQLLLYDDASSTVGFGAYWSSAWFSQSWPTHLSSEPIVTGKNSIWYSHRLRDIVSTGAAKEFCSTATTSP